MRNTHRGSAWHRQWHLLCYRLRAAGLACAVAGLLSLPGALPVAQAADAAERRAAIDGTQWPDFHGGPAGLHYSPLDEIDARNVMQLKMVWTHSPDLQTEGLQSIPVEADGVLAYCSGADRIWVLDAVTGRLRWHVRAASLPEPAAGPDAGHNEAAQPGAAALTGAAARDTTAIPCRGLALEGGVLYYAGAGGRVMAWTAATGVLRWSTRVVPRDGSQGVLSGPPQLAGGHLVVGSSVVSAQSRGVLVGLDLHTGHEQWRHEVMLPAPPSLGGSYAAAPSAGPPLVGAASPGAPSPGAPSAAVPAPAPPGGSVWMPGAYDPVRNLIYWGTGSPLPLFDWAGSDYKTHGPHPGENPHSGGVLALDPDTGALHAWHQELPHEVWVRDSAVSEILLIERDGRHYVIHPNRSGLVFVYDADLALQQVWPAAKNLNFFSSVDARTGLLEGRRDFNAGEQRNVCPDVEGALPGLPGAYSPQTGLWYKVGAEWCMDLHIDHGSSMAQHSDSERRAALGGYATSMPPKGERARGHLDARDPLTGSKVWTVGFPEPPLASLLATGGRLLFVADGRGVLQALDAGTGRSLWQDRQRDGHAGGVISYQAGGHQFIAVMCGWDSADHPAHAQLFGAPYTGSRTPHAAIRVYRLP